MINCPICRSSAEFFIEKKDRLGQSYQYYCCQNCGFLFEKEVTANPPADLLHHLEQKVSKLYGGDYFAVTDSGWQQRGDWFLKNLHRFLRLLSIMNSRITILDFGAGNGYITSKLASRYPSYYYDKYEEPTYPGSYQVLTVPEKKDVVVAVELVEHLTNMHQWQQLHSLSGKAFVFTTEVSDGIDKKELADWWYFNPDAGHTAIYSLQSLFLLARRYGFFYFFYPSKSCHFFVRSKWLCNINFVAFEYAIFKILRKIKARIFKC